MKDIASIVTFFTVIIAISLLMGAFYSMRESMLWAGLLFVVLTAVPVTWKN